jgi:hypothetical protein
VNAPRKRILSIQAPREIGAELAAHLGVVIRVHFDRATCAKWIRGVRQAKREWTSDFGGEQFSLGRAFYTHLEEAKTRAYFADAAASDARVEANLPGLQTAMVALAQSLTGARVGPRSGFCGAGVHVFPAGGAVAKKGGVIHFDTEGLSRHHLAKRRRALSIVAMLGPAGRGGGLRLFDVLFAGHDSPTSDEIAAPRETVRYGVGDVVVFDSYRLHQIRPFAGEIDRISATIHAAEVDPGVWETWF